MKSVAAVHGMRYANNSFEENSRNEIFEHAQKYIVMKNGNKLFFFMFLCLIVSCKHGINDSSIITLEEFSMFIKLGYGLNLKIF